MNEKKNPKTQLQKKPQFDWRWGHTLASYIMRDCDHMLFCCILYLHYLESCMWLIIFWSCSDNFSEFTFFVLRNEMEQVGIILKIINFFNLGYILRSYIHIMSRLVQMIVLNMMCFTFLCLCDFLDRLFLFRFLWTYFWHDIFVV